MHGVTWATELQVGRTGRIKLAAVVAATLLVAACGDGHVRGNGNPLSPGNAQQVHLIWKQADNSWKVKLNNGPEENPAQARTKLAPDTGPTMFVVDIAGNAATFSKTEPLSVWTGDKAQPKQGINSTQILGPIVDSDGKKLVFFDLNYGNAVTLNYSLHFNEPGIPPVDPIVDNGGGNWSL